jgi:hypothetical protein
MATADEIQRIAAAMNALRPDWKPSSLVTFLTKHHSARAYRDLAIAGTAVATDTRTKTPQLLNEHGPWWVAAQTAAGNTTDHRYARCEQPGHTSFAAWNCAACRSEKLAADDTQTATPTLAITEDQAAINARGARTVLRAHHAALARTNTKETDQ